MAPENEQDLCWLCGRVPSEVAYRSGESERRVCRPCLDRLTVQDAYEGQLIHLDALEKAGRTDDALACLDAILESNRERDHDGWLARSIASHRALTFSLAGRHSDAERALHDRAKLGFADAWDRYEHGLAKSRTLEALHRDDDAAAALTEALEHEDARYYPTAIALMSRLAALLEKLGRPMPAGWMNRAHAAAAHHGIQVPTGDSPAQILSTLLRALRSLPAGPPRG